MATVLIVDDEADIRELVRINLEIDGHTVIAAENGIEALEYAVGEHPDVVVLDVMMPAMDGWDTLAEMKSSVDRVIAEIPVIMLTARTDDVDKIVGLEMGADDYVTKPFSPRELVLRVQSVLRRTASSAAHTVREAGGAPALVDGDVEVDTRAHRVWRSSHEVALTAREFDLLVHLLRCPGRAFTREELMRTVWGWEFGDLSTVTVHVRRLREKLEADPSRPVRLVTVWGVGYRWDPQGGR